jgi:putative transposase
MPVARDATGMFQCLPRRPKRLMRRICQRGSSICKTRSSRDVEEALARHGTPEIFNTDQGSQFTSTDFIKVLAAREIKISMDGKGAWRDNVFVERLWRSIKYEEVYLRAYASVSEARAGIGRYLTFYNSRRPHSSLDGRTPDQAYFNQPMPQAVAA